MTSNIAVQPLFKPSAWWLGTSIALYAGELAWEIAEVDAEGKPSKVYLLRGDGEPANGGTAGSYTRLRVDASSFAVGPVTLQAVLDSLAESIALETTAREAADTGLGAAITELSNDLTEAIENETEERTEADAGLEAAITELGDNFTEALGTEETARTEADEAIDERLTTVEETYAPLESPHFTGEPEVPDPFVEPDGTPKPELNFSQAVPLETWRRVHELTMSTAGHYLRQTDTDTNAAFTHERRLDYADGYTVYEARETDHITWLDGDFVTQAEWDEIRDLVMSTSGENLRAADSAAGVVNRDNRIVDRVFGDAEYRDLDIVTGGDDYIRLSRCHWVDA